MDAFPDGIAFRHAWRPYQRRVLDEMDSHLGDGRLHVIAPPGSGKTVLGLEVVRRLNRPTLILSPTLPIRDQWADRFLDLFLSGQTALPDWISLDLRRPAFMTVATYQGLHALLSGKEPEAALTILDAARFRTVVLDEAHHLKNEWWKSLTNLLRRLEKPVTVALTATPPYDVPHEEWERYKAVCGPVDTEITVPELILEANLCPHQDYLYLSRPTESETAAIREFRENIRAITEELGLDPDFLDALESHPWIASPREHLDAMADDPEYGFSLLVFLRHAGRYIPPETLEILGLADTELPPLSDRWLQVLLTRALHSDQERFSPPVLAEIRRRLKRMGALERRQVSLTEHRDIHRTVSASMAKLEAIVEIVAWEHESLGPGLRLVILTDYLHRADMPTFIDDLKPIRRMGVVPIFERLRREYHWDVRLGVLTGTLVIVPESAVADLEISAATLGMDSGAIARVPLGHDPGYVAIEVAGASRRNMVRLVTELFAMGRVNVLVGTKALLGEGWDAPSINSLILASFVGSHVLSNQTRGRAIRVDPRDPDKAANIWHLACVEPDHPSGGADWSHLRRRFKAFVGVGLRRDVIESGMGRMDLPESPTDAIADLNHVMKTAAADRQSLADRWHRAVRNGVGKAVMRERLQSPAPLLRDRFLIRSVSGPCRSTMLWLLFSWLFAGAAFQIPAGFPRHAAVVLAVLCGIGLIRRLPSAIRGLWRHLIHGAEGNRLREIAEILQETLVRFQLLETPPERLAVRISPGRSGTISCQLAGGTGQETALFLDSLQELLEPVEAPRYLLVESRAKGGKTYRAVPGLIGKNKSQAVFFHQRWQERVGPADLVFTRNPEGKTILLQARIRGFSGPASSGVERDGVWA